VRIADGPSIVGDNVWDLVLAENLSFDFADLDSSFTGIDAVSLEAALGVVKDAEVLAGLLNGQDVHQTARVTVISPNFVVNLNVRVFVSADLESLNSCEGVLQPQLEDHVQWNAMPHFVGAGGWTSGVHAIKFRQHPVVGCKHALHMLFRSSSL